MQIVDGRRAPELARGEVLAISCLSFVTAQRARGFESVPKSGIALSHHDVSKKDLDLGLSVH